MKPTAFIGTILTLITFSFNLYAVEYCKNINNKENQKCIIPIHKVRPTQFLIGILPIKDKITKIQNRYKKNKLTNKTISKIIPAIFGPDQNYYILDGHHSSYALSKSNIPQQNKVIYINVIKDCSKCGFYEFENFMNRPGNSYLYGSKYTKNNFFELPKSLNDLTDCPYRSLSWKLREMGCYKKVNVNFLEFLWADALKRDLEFNGISMNETHKNKIKKISAVYCEKIKDSKFSKLPGYKRK